jgi:hypothetical protein
MNDHLFEYRRDKLMPNSFRWFVGQGLMTFTPWYFCNLLNDFEFVSKAFLKEDLKEREIMTILRRQDRDDFAGFEIKDGEIQENIIYFHPTFGRTKSNIELGNYNNLFDFIRLIAINDMEEWASTEDFEDYEDN